MTALLLALLAPGAVPKGPLTRYDFGAGAWHVRVWGEGVGVRCWTLHLNPPALSGLAAGRNEAWGGAESCRGFVGDTNFTAEYRGRWRRRGGRVVIRDLLVGGRVPFTWVFRLDPDGLPVALTEGPDAYRVKAWRAGTPEPTGPPDGR